MFAYTAVKLYQRQQFIKKGNRGNEAYSTMKKKQFVVSYVLILTIYIELCDSH